MVTLPITCAPGATHADSAMDGDDSICAGSQAPARQSQASGLQQAGERIALGHTVTMVRMSPVAVLADSVRASTGMVAGGTLWRSTTRRGPSLLRPAWGKRQARQRPARPCSGHQRCLGQRSHRSPGRPPLSVKSSAPLAGSAGAAPARRQLPHPAHGGAPGAQEHARFSSISGVSPRCHARRLRALGLATTVALEDRSFHRAAGDAGAPSSPPPPPRRPLRAAKLRGPERAGRRRRWQRPQRSELHHRGGRPGQRRARGAFPQPPPPPLFAAAAATAFSPPSPPPPPILAAHAPRLCFRQACKNDEHADVHDLLRRLRTTRDPSQGSLSER